MAKNDVQRLIDARKTRNSGVANLSIVSGGNPGAIADMSRPYATRVVAASNSLTTDKAKADHVCDGVSDQLEINKAIESAGHVVLLDGTYYISDNIVLATGTRITGASMYGTVILGTGANNLFVAEEQHYGVTISDMTIKSGVGISGDITSSNIERVRFTTCTYGMNCDYANGINVVDCQFDECTIGIYVNIANGVLIDNCRFLKCSTKAAQLVTPARSFFTNNLVRQCGYGLVLGS